MSDLLELAGSIPPEAIHPDVGIPTSLIAGLPASVLSEAIRESFRAVIETNNAKTATGSFITKYEGARQAAETQGATPRNKSETDELCQAADDLANAVPDFMPRPTQEVIKQMHLAEKVQAERWRLSRPYCVATAIGGFVLGFGIAFGVAHPTLEHLAPQVEAMGGNITEVEAGTQGLIVGGFVALGNRLSTHATGQFARHAARRQVKKARKSHGPERPL